MTENQAPYVIRHSITPGNVYVRSLTPIGHTVNRDEFAQAVRDLGFVVIDKAELPDMFREQAEAIVSNTVGGLPGIKQARDRAIAILAATAYLEANPPIDPKVEALAEILRAAVGVTPESSAAGHLIPSSSAEVAARMFATGRIDIKEAS